MGCTGVLACILDALVLIALVEVARLPVAAAAFTGACAGAAISYSLNKSWVFRAQKPVSLGELLRFGAVALGNALGTAGLMHLLTSQAHAPYLLAKVVSAAALFACWSYPTQSRLVFGRAGAEPSTL